MDDRPTSDYLAALVLWSCEGDRAYDDYINHGILVHGAKVYPSKLVVTFKDGKVLELAVTE